MKLPIVNDARRLETVAVLAGACLVIGLVLELALLFHVALGLLAIGVFVKPLSRWLAMGWLAIAELIGKVVSVVLLSLVFIVVLVPVAALSRLAGKTAPTLRRSPPPGATYFAVREHEFVPKDFENAH
ncbi:MAG: hypothetical protein FJ109_17900 [Deltaproteobacteria bacterium]|nr:hypothetical protein [Deltaproteobacteria bacterium]